jgi:protein-S-isoprenylcysteine O-methyltransferase Ste14
MKTQKILSAIHIAGILVVAQYILAFFVYNLPGNKALQYAGWAVWVPALISGIGPIYILRRKGGVAKGKSYVETTRLVETSLYAIVRHPQYLGGMLFNLALMLMAQQWLVFLIGIVSMGLIYHGMRDADQDIEKFGDDYRQYMQRVPQINFPLGIFRHIQANRAGLS